MNGIGKAGGILAIVASGLGIFYGVIMALFGTLFSAVGADGVGKWFLIISITIIVISIIIIIWSTGYISRGTRKWILVVLLIISAVLSILIFQFLLLILYIVAAVFVAIGREKLYINTFESTDITKKRK